jgi:allantoicase
MDIRVKDPREQVQNKIEHRKIKNDDEHLFGRPYAPSTPIKDVMRNFFGDIGVQITQQR